MEKAPVVYQNKFTVKFAEVTYNVFATCDYKNKVVDFIDSVTMIILGEETEISKTLSENQIEVLNQKIMAKL